MDYKETAEQVRNGHGDLPLVTKVLADLLEDLAPKSEENTAPESEEGLVIEPDKDTTPESEKSMFIEPTVPTDLPGENPLIPPKTAS